MKVYKTYFDEYLPKRIIWAITVALIFGLLPLMASYTYFRFLDKTEYYTVVQPIPVSEKWYKPCDDVVLVTTRTSLMDLKGDVQTDLVLKQGNDVIFKVPNARYNRQVSIKQGTKIVVSISYPLPCNLADGLYYWQITLGYKVRGFEHQYTAISDTFNVNQYGLSPDVIRAATSGAKLIPAPPVRNPAVRVEPTQAPQQGNQSNQGSQGSGATTINNYQQSQPEPTQAPQPTPNPTPTPKSLVCNLLGVCL